MTRWEAALPFLFTAVLVIVGQLASTIVRQLRLRCYFQEQIDAANLQVSAELTAESIAQSSDWAGDAVQVAGAVLLPAAGFFLLVEANLTRWEPAAYFGASAVSLILLLFVLGISDPTTYGRKYRFVRMSVVNLVALGLNITLGVAAFLLVSEPSQPSKPSFTVPANCRVTPIIPVTSGSLTIVRCP